VLQGIRCVLDGKLYLSQKVALLMAEKLLESKATTADAQAAARGSQVELLSDRELEVFQLLGRGLSTRRIAEELHISVKTVQAIHARIKEKLRLSSATELLREAVRWHDREQET
jgi:DNA-binding NarL/FixJ family response regulator